MYHVLKSKKDGKLYTGFTNSLRMRIRDHNDGIVASTRSRKPFELIYSEGYKSEKDARYREKILN